MAKGGFTYPYCAWWLRSPGNYSNGAAYVLDGGIIRDDGNYVISYYGVRPALWINIG